MTDEDYFICDICGERFETKNALGGHISGHSRRIPDKQLLAELDRLEDELGRSPTIREMDELGNYSAATYKERFDSWTNALRLVGYEPIQEYRVCNEAILDEIDRLADPHGTPPTATEMRSKGKYSVKLAQNQFGSWNEALQAAGYDPHHRHQISDEALLEEIHRLVEEFDKVPTAQEMSDHGQYSHRPISVDGTAGRLLFGLQGTNRLVVLLVQTITNGKSNRHTNGVDTVTTGRSNG